MNVKNITKEQLKQIYEYLSSRNREEMNGVLPLSEYATLEDAITVEDNDIIITTENGWMTLSEDNLEHFQWKIIKMLSTFGCLEKDKGTTLFN